MVKVKSVIGVDVSKLTLDLALFRENGHVESFKIKNTPGDIEVFLSQTIKKYKMRRASTIFVAEDSGYYCEYLKQACRNSSWKVYLEHPLRIKLSIGIARGKTDKLDAIRIAEYGVNNHHKFIDKKPLSKVLLEMKQLLLFRQKLKGITQGFVLTEKFLKYDEDRFYFITPFYANTRKSLSDDVGRIEGEIKSKIQEDAGILSCYRILNSIPGIGHIVALHLITYTNAFANFRTANQFCSYSGIAPFKFESGTSVKRRDQVSAIGSRKMKNILFIAANASIKAKKSHFRKYYERKRKEGKAHFSALNAVSNKIVHTAFACVKSNKKYQYDG